MNSSELVFETEQEEESQGWLATFADLMSLLMCFFVLLLSFSELDVIKFKQIAGSMKYAFGVQREINVNDIPRGTSVIAQEFSSAITEPTILDVVKQQSFDTESPSLSPSGSTSEEDLPNNSSNQVNKKANQLFQLQEQITEKLKEELNRGQFEMENLGQQLVIRIQENGTFASGSGFLQPKIKPLIRKLSDLIYEIPGKVVVSGHTDDRPLHNELYLDNMALSAARALAVARVMQNQNDHPYLIVSALGSAEPLNKNSNEAQRRLNRRVEITVNQGLPKLEQLSLKQANEE